AVVAQPIDRGLLPLLFIAVVERGQGRRQAGEPELAKLDLTADAKQLKLDLLAGPRNLRRDQRQHEKSLRTCVRNRNQIAVNLYSPDVTRQPTQARPRHPLHSPVFSSYVHHPSAGDS